jgi:protocatechuate 3,4-dioxygenase beta subunit
MDRIVRWTAALACLAVVAGLVDVTLRPLEVVPIVPPTPDTAGVRDATLRVAVVGHRGERITQASVRAFFQSEGRHFAAGHATTGPDGTALLSALPHGAFWVIAEAEGHGRASKRLELGAGEQRTELSLPEEQRLKVSVYDDAGAPVGRATVLVKGGDALPHGALTSGDGTAEVRRLGSAPWQVTVSARGYESVTRKSVADDLVVSLRRLGSLEVRVLEPGGARAAGAEVSLAGSGLWPARRLTTNEQGVARAFGIPAGAYQLRAVRGTLVSETLHGFELTRGQDAEVTLTLTEGRMVTAVVTDGDAESAPLVPNANVVLVEGGVSSFPLRGRTGADGSVTLGPIAKGPASLSAMAAEFIPRSAVPVPEPLAAPVRIPLLRGGTLRGSVVDSRDFPIDGASIEVIGTDVYGLPVAQTPMLMNFGFSHFEWAMNSPVPLIPSGELGVMPGPIPPIPGSTPGGDAALNAGAALRALVDADHAARVDPWVTRSDGEFVARPVSPGRVRALVRHPDYVEGLSELVTLGPGGEARVRVVLHAGGSLEGRVLDDRDFPVAGARIDVAATRGTWQRTTQSGPDGSYSFAAVPGEVLLSLARPEEITRFVLRKQVSVPPGERMELDLRLPAAREAVRVRVVDEAAQPVDAAQVTALSLDPDVPLRSTLFTSTAGEVTIEDARGIKLRILAEAPGWVRAVRVVEAAPESIELRLARGALVEGRVTAVRGRIAVPTATIVLSAEGGTRSVALSDDDGVYRFKDVPQGPVVVTVSHPDYAEARLETVVGEATRADRPIELPPIDLEEPGSIEGDVVDDRGQPVLGARVAVGPVPAYLPAGALPPGVATTNADGYFRLSGVAPGSVTVEAYAAGAGRGRADGVAVTAGRSTLGVRIRIEHTSEGSDPPLGAGVAVTLGEDDTDQGVLIRIVQVAANSEAERAGVRAGDAIDTIDGHRPRSLGDARSRLSGPRSTDVVIALDREGEKLSVRVARELVRQ